MDAKQLDTLLRRLSITENYVGFEYLRCAVSLAVERPERLLRVTKELYPTVAERFGVSCPSVLRDISTVIGVAWTLKRSMFPELLQYQPDRKPTVAQFIGILAIKVMS